MYYSIKFAILFDYLFTITGLAAISQRGSRARNYYVHIKTFSEIIVSCILSCKTSKPSSLLLEFTKLFLPTNGSLA